MSLYSPYDDWFPLQARPAFKGVRQAQDIADLVHGQNGALGASWIARDLPPELNFEALVRTYGHNADIDIDTMLFQVQRAWPKLAAEAEFVHNDISALTEQMGVAPARVQFQAVSYSPEGGLNKHYHFDKLIKNYRQYRRFLINYNGVGTVFKDRNSKQIAAFPVGSISTHDGRFYHKSPTFDEQFLSSMIDPGGLRLLVVADYPVEDERPIRRKLGDRQL